MGVWVGMMTVIVLNVIAQYKIVSSVNIRMYLKETQQRLKREDAGKKTGKINRDARFVARIILNSSSR